MSILLAYIGLPVAATIFGGVIATFRTPGRRLSSAIQHFAAGVVFAAVATELLPNLGDNHRAPAIVLGFIFGVAAMLGVKWLLEQLGDGKSEESPLSLVATIAVDMFIDGLLIGIGFAASTDIGVLLTVALTIELLFLGLSAAVGLGQANVARGRTIMIIVGLALLVLVGALGGSLLLANLPGYVQTAVFAFGAMALLYLVTEELLLEAHEEPDTLLVTTMFFAGFIVLYILE